MFLQSLAVRVAIPALTLVFLTSSSASSAAQSEPAAVGITVSGRLYHSVSLKPIAGAIVAVEGTKLEAKSAADGTYSIPNVPTGSNHLLVTAKGFVPTRAELTVAQAPVTVDVAVDPELHYSEVVSVGPDAKSQFDSYQPTAVLAGQDLMKQLGSTVGATLSTQPGVAERSMGPGPSRPVIRGLDGDRVLILEDGQRVGDLSSQSSDHGVPVNPASATRIEVVRGPATLLYGSNAIGGLVNVINDTIPTQRVNGAHGGATFDFGTGAAEAVGGGDVLWGNNTFAVHASGSGQRTGNVDTPEGEIENSQSRAGFASVGMSWTGEHGYVGGSYGYDDTKYGIPVVEEGQTQLTPRRQTVAFRGGADNLNGLFTSFRALAGYRHYRHDELDGEEVVTQFENNTTDLNLQAKHKAFGRLTGTIGGFFLTRAFSALGEEALSPPVDEHATALFVYEELGWSHVTLQFGGASTGPAFHPRVGFRSGTSPMVRDPLASYSGRRRLMTSCRSQSIWRARPAILRSKSSTSSAHTSAISPSKSETLSLESETALGFDASVRWRHRRFSGELTYFHNSIDNYIFRNPLTDEEFAERFPGEETDGLQPVEFVARDSVLQGVEVHTDLELGQGLFAELGFDFVRGELRDTNEPLPRIPPARFIGGLRYQRNAFQAGGEVIAAAKQDRVYGAETPTDGYTLS